MSKLIVIIGITGLQGGSVARAFQNDPGWRIRGITRNPGKHADLAEQGIELVGANLDDRASLEAAFAGAHAIFAVTDFWQFVGEEATVALAAAQGKAVNTVAMELEEQQGRNVIDAAATAEVARTLERFVVSTLSDTRRWSRGEIRWNLHFDGKASYTAYLKTQAPRWLAERSSYLQMGYYLSNWRMAPAFAPQKQADGSFVIRYFLPLNAGKLPFVDPPNDTGHFVRALVLAAPPGTAMLGVCEEMTIEQYTALWGKVHGVPCRYEFLDSEGAVKNGMPEWLVTEVQASATYVDRFGWTGGDPEVKMPSDVGVDVSQLTKVEDAIRRDDWSSVL